MDFGRCPGYSLLELLCLSSLVSILAAMALPQVADGIERARVAAATRYLAGRFQLARMEAVKRTAYVGVRFEQVGEHVGFSVYVDRNGNGIRSRDIASGVDRQLAPIERLLDHFPRVEFGILPGVTAIDDGSALVAGSDPVRLGSADIASFGPNGTATAGSVYIRSARYQRAVRILGATGRVRTLRFDAQAGSWLEP